MVRKYKLCSIIFFDLNFSNFSKKYFSKNGQRLVATQFLKSYLKGLKHLLSQVGRKLRFYDINI
jgi:hypothetical protein